MDFFINEKLDTKKITIADVAEALNISKTTVSRAISGKGRVSEDTKQKVLEYIEKNNYKPNVIAKGLAQQKTYNIALVIPGDCNLVDMPFFQNSMQGICEEAANQDYDVMLVTTTEDDYSRLERMILNNKVDGVILSRSKVKDEAVEFLKKNAVPFILMGTSNDESILQVDNDHQAGCCELVQKILNNNCNKIGLIGGSRNYTVNRLRLLGYRDAFKRLKNEIDETFIYNDCISNQEIENAVKKLLEKGIECIVCMDDSICSVVLQLLTKMRIKVPEKLQVASFYDSTLLKNNLPGITSLVFDDKELGRNTCSVMLRYISGEAVNAKTLLKYEIVSRESTREL